MILTPLQKLPNYVGILAKIIVATSFQWLPKVQKIVQSGHTVSRLTQRCPINQFSSSQKMKKEKTKNNRKKIFSFLLLLLLLARPSHDVFQLPLIQGTGHGGSILLVTSVYDLYSCPNS